jgi:prophage maintenance system killer protein
VGEIELYVSADGSVNLDVRTDGDAVWLSQLQMTTLFGRDLSTISRHVANARREELSGLPTVAKFAIVQQEGVRTVERQVDHYNLDVVLSVGYRVKSSEGIRFRRWASDVLTRYVIAGVATNDSRLEQISAMARMLERSKNPELVGIAEILSHYSPALKLLDEYDHGTLKKPRGTEPSEQLDYVTARAIVDELARQFPKDEMFGSERDGSFHGILGAVEQTYADQDLYPTVQEKAAHLLYFVVKDHPFSDGNKRSAAALFTYYLSLNGALQNGNGEDMVSSNALAAITLMTAMSRPDEKETITQLVTNMLDGAL